jgi:hypothetical protein
MRQRPSALVNASGAACADAASSAPTSAARQPPLQALQGLALAVHAQVTGRQHLQRNLEADAGC